MDTDTNTNGTIEDDEKGLLGGQSTANVLFPTYLVEGMHGSANIDECGAISNSAPAITHTEHGTDGADDCADGTGFRASADAEGGVVQIVKDPTTKNVGDLNVGNAEPVAFNHLTGHFTEALISTAAGGSDQTASWGGTPVVRPAVHNNNNMMMLGNYTTLNGANPDAMAENDIGTLGTEEPTYTFGGRLAEKDAAGNERIIANTVDGYSNNGGNAVDNEEATEGKIADGAALNRGLNGGGILLPALHGGGEETHQVVLLLSLADDFGDQDKGKGGDYSLMAAKTGYKVTLQDNMGNTLPDPAAVDDPVFGGTESADVPAGVNIIVDGIRVMTDADLGKCTGTMIPGAWTLANLTSLVPTASSGAKKFAGLDNAGMDPMMNATPGLIKFLRNPLTCKMDFGDGDASTGSTVEDNDGVPTSDERSYTTGTLVVEEANTDRTFVTTGQLVLKFLTADSTFAASWSLKSDPSKDDTAREAIDYNDNETGDGFTDDIITRPETVPSS